MKKNSNNVFLIFVFSIFSLVSCDDTEPENVTGSTTGTLRLYIEHVGTKVSSESNEHSSRISNGNHSSNEPLYISDSLYVTANHDTVSITAFNYLLTDFSYVKDGDTMTNSAVAFFIRHDLDQTSDDIEKLITEIPVGTYSNINFLLGVNDEANLTDNVTGELEDAFYGGMVWTWSTGYKFAKIEGFLYSGGDTTAITKHIGTSTNKRDITIDNEFTISEGLVTEVHLQVDISDVLGGVSLGSTHSSHKLTSDINAIIMDSLAAQLSNPHHFMQTNEEEHNH